MNERIKELAAKAAEYAEDSDGPFDDAYTARFAELIVKECVNVGINAFHADNSVVPVFPAVAIKQHFGVDQ